MAATGTAPIKVTLEKGIGGVATPTLLSAMLHATPQVSDLVFSPGRPPQVEVLGQLIPVEVANFKVMTADDTRRIAADLIGSNKQAITLLREQGSCDISYGIAGVARFRVNVFIQRGSCAVIMRVIPTTIPDFAALGLPGHLKEIADLKDGIVLVTGARGSGKSSTLAALLDEINRRKTCHIITIEDPIEFLHNHKQATIHQRELHSDTPSFAHALKAALRQAPRVILLGEMLDSETMKMALEAAETGHLVLSCVNTVDAAKTVERLVRATEHEAVRSRVAKSLRFVIAQRLIPRKDGQGRVAAFEILKVCPRILESLEQEDPSGQLLLRAMKEGALDGMQHFDAEIEKLVKSGIVEAETALAYASDPKAMKAVLHC
ncbi:MAG TPA: PilT/PilU family type 4a pilus ATPase [Terriglobales bacterium]|nr:PilT/PilU family type 4a pilus ATPase [Terriglobales bacterium]